MAAGQFRRSARRRPAEALGPDRHRGRARCHPDRGRPELRSNIRAGRLDRLGAQVCSRWPGGSIMAEMTGPCRLQDRQEGGEDQYELRLRRTGNTHKNDLSSAKHVEVLPARLRHSAGFCHWVVGAPAPRPRGHPCQQPAPARSARAGSQWGRGYNDGTAARAEDVHAGGAGRRTALRRAGVRPAHSRAPPTTLFRSGQM